MAALTRGGLAWLLLWLPGWATAALSWPTFADNMDLWNNLSTYQTLVVNNSLRLSDLSIRMVNDPNMATVGDKIDKFRVRDISECKCRLECLALRACLSFTFVPISDDVGKSRCTLFDKRGPREPIGPDKPGTYTMFKMLNAAIGDVCQIDVECARQTGEAFCSPSGLCACQNDFVEHKGTCVDPMSLTTTTIATTTTVEPTTTTIPTTTTVATTPASTTLASMLPDTMDLDESGVTAEWPCDEDNHCSFFEEFPDSPPSNWQKTVKGAKCLSDGGRCRFPAILFSDSGEEDSTSGVSRVETWTGSGQFFFRMNGDGSTDPENLDTADYTPGSNDANAEWKYDCSTSGGVHNILTGIMGLARFDVGGNIPRDMDLLLCTRFANIHLTVDPTNGDVLDVTTMGEHVCPTGYVATGVWDSQAHFLKPKKVKCSRLVAGTVDTDSCTQMDIDPNSTEDIYWNACNQEKPQVVTGFELKKSGEVYRWLLKCCLVTGPATTLNT